jgi:hypothetical protein
MKEGVDALHAFGDAIGIADVDFAERKLRLIDEWVEILLSAGGEVVDTSNSVASVE